MESFVVTAFYHFFPISAEDVQRVRDELDDKGKTLDMYGLVLVATEGFNGTVAGSAEAIEEWKRFIHDINDDIAFKDSVSDRNPFKRWFVKVRDEIVGLGDPSVLPEGKRNHVTPKQWNKMMEEEDAVIIDTRNDYEVRIGKFKGAVDPNLKQFNEFPEYVKKCGIPKDKKVMMYCTGGIRCEKALIEMQKQGYEHVYQLDGGILKYLEKYPHEKFDGECFVFDHRTAVDQELRPTQTYGLCPHTGDPAPCEITCNLCGKNAKVSESCLDSEDLKTCSKNCAEMYRRQKAKRTLSARS